jgi:hypothetical protein
VPCQVARVHLSLKLLEHRAQYHGTHVLTLFPTNLPTSQSSASQCPPAPPPFTYLHASSQCRLHPQGGIFKHQALGGLRGAVWVEGARCYLSMCDKEM